MPKASNEKLINLSVSEMLEDEILKAVLTVIEDGICFLSSDLDVLYANPAMHFWYDMEERSIGEKCYQAYHNRKKPCENCPVLKSLQSKQPETASVLYEKNNKKEGWQRILCTPILNGAGDVLMIIEYIRDVTDETKNEMFMDLLKSQVEALTDLIEQKEAERKQKEQQLVGNMNKSIDTVLNYLNRMLDEDSYQLIKKQLEITKYGAEKESVMAVKLSDQELMTARLIAEGYLSKEIADELNISKKTVDYYRTNLRKKLGLKADDNLKKAVKEFLIRAGI